MAPKNNPQLTADVANILEQLEQQKEAMDDMRTTIGGLETDNQRLVAELGGMGEAATLFEENRARSLMPTNLSSTMESKLAFAKDMFPRSRMVYQLLDKDPPDIRKARELVGQMCRLSNNFVAGAELSKQAPKKPLQFLDHYYEETRSAALKAPESAEWFPEQELVKYEKEKKSALKILEAELLKEAAAGSSAGGGGSALKRRQHFPNTWTPSQQQYTPPLQQQQQQQRNPTFPPRPPQQNGGRGYGGGGGSGSR